MNVALSGFTLWLSLMVSIGPQNIFILKSGIRRLHVGVVIAVCMISDVFLVLGGTAGVSAVLSHVPGLLPTLKWAGACYLLYFAFTCFKDAVHTTGMDLGPDPKPSEAHPENGIDYLASDLPLGGPSANSNGGVGVADRTRKSAPMTAAAAATTALALTWLNPLSIIDTVMFGSIAAQYGAGQWLFAGGALCATLVWFPVLGYGARLLSKPLSSPKVWRGLNIGVGCFMLFIIFRLLFLMH
ncbi:MAG: LysE family transporter [Corynebacterium sp.]|nr:LysE family transporter [Corynebacterium sp.]